MKLKLTSEKIYNKQFQGVPKGYDPEEVDKFIDVIIDDYSKMEEYIKTSSNDLQMYKMKSQVLQKQVDSLESEINILKDKTDSINSSNIDNSSSSLEYLKRINALEKALKNAKIDPKQIK